MAGITALRLALIQNQLDHIAHIMGSVMERTARSPIFSESHDFSCFIADAQSNMLSLADGLPIHSGGGQLVVAALLRDFEGQINSGDVFLASDPYDAGNNHLPDWTMLRPVFVNGQLFAFTCNRAHQSDIGGGAAGTYNPAATEIFHEGIRLPVIKLVDKGVVRHDIWKLLTLNSRCPELLDGDVRAMLGSTEVGAREVEKLVVEYGANEARECFAALLDYSERQMRNALRELPFGVFEGEDLSYTDCFERTEVRIHVTIRHDESGLEIDFEGSSPQIRGFKNSSIANTNSAAFMAVLSFLKVNIVRNQGTFRPIRIKAPEGTIANARYPAAMTMNTTHPAFEIIHAIWKALAKARPDWACAGWGKTVHCISSGFQPGSDERFIMYHWHGYPGAGATAERDGFHTMGGIYTLGGLKLPNVEGYERLFPVLFHKYEIRTDTAGAGQKRGGSGVSYSADMKVPGEYSFRGEGLEVPTGFGINGGCAGAAGEIAMEVDGQFIPDLPVYGVRQLPPLRVDILSPGGGGWGNPLERDAAAVHEDVLNEIISPKHAEEAYGVVLTAGGEIDLAATEQVRAARLAEIS